MKTLYDLLGARPDDDAEELRSAFRKAAKANHPDLNVGDPDAPSRFRQIVQAYDILRDAQQRATYDQLLKFERDQLRWNLTHTLSYLKSNILSDAIAVVSLAIVLGGGGTLFAYVSKTRVAAVNPAQFTAPGPVPAKIATVPPAAQADTIEPSGVRDRFHFMTIRQADIEADADRSEKKPLVERLDPERPQSIEVSPSSPEKGNVSPERDNGGAKSNSSALAMSGDEHDTETPSTPDAGAGDVRTSDVKISVVKISDTTTSEAKTSDANISEVKTSDANISEVKTPDTMISDAKMPETKTPARRRTVAIRQTTTNRTAFERVSLEDKNTPTCSGSCSNAPPLFGVGF